MHSGKTHRFHLLDGLRGIAALAVALWHLPTTQAMHDSMSGYLAVDFFFCLSGFVIAYSYEDRLRTGMGLREFFTVRLIRVYPVYLAAITLGLVYFLSQNDVAHHLARFIPFLILQFALLPNIRVWPQVSLFLLDGPAWSLFLELLANLVFAWLVLKKRASTPVLLASSVVMLALISGFLYTHGQIDVGWGSYPGGVFGIPRVGFSCFVGALMARFYARMTLPQLSGGSNLALALLVAIALSLLLLTPFTWMHSRVFIFLTFAVFFPALVLVGALIRIPHGAYPLCAWLGEMSYPFYLLREPCISLLEGHIGGLSAVWRCILLALATGVLSALVLRLIDVPARAYLRKHLRPKKPAPLPGAVAA